MHAEQLTFDDMPARLFACTPSRLATFECPRRYRFTYLDRPGPARGLPWAHNTIGANAHVALHRWWLLPRSQRVPERGAELVARNWQNNGFRDERQSARACDATSDWVERYLTDQVSAADEPIGVERTVAARTRTLALSGRLDRIDDRDGELIVVDYKTGRHVPTDADAAASPALALYAVGVEATLRRACRRVELHHLPTGTVASFDHSDSSMQRHVERAEATGSEIVVATERLARGADPDAVFPPVVSAACTWCDFRRSCPQGRAASPDRAPWDGLPAGIAEAAPTDQRGRDQKSSSASTRAGGFSTAGECAAPGTTT